MYNIGDKLICKEKVYIYEDKSEEIMMSDLGDMVIIYFSFYGSTIHTIINTKTRLSKVISNNDLDTCFETIQERRIRLINEYV